MTREEAIEILQTADFPEDYTVEEIQQALNMAIQALEQDSILDKIRAEMQRLRGCSCNCSDGIIDDVEDIIDKYKAESDE